MGFVFVPTEFIEFYMKFFVYFQVYIHPFADGNGRVSRLLMNLLLESFDYPAAIISVYERPEYIKSLNAAHHGDVRSFVRFGLSQLDATIEVCNCRFGFWVLQKFLDHIKPSPKPFNLMNN